MTRWRRTTGRPTTGLGGTPARLGARRQTAGHDSGNADLRTLRGAGVSHAPSRPCRRGIRAFPACITNDRRASQYQSCATRNLDFCVMEPTRKAAPLLRVQAQSADSHTALASILIRRGIAELRVGVALLDDMSGKPRRTAVRRSREALEGDTIGVLRRRAFRVSYKHHDRGRTWHRSRRAHASLPSSGAWSQATITKRCCGARRRTFAGARRAVRSSHG